MEDSLVQETVERYIREYDRYKKLADIVFDICQNLVQKKLTIRATVQHRVKSPTSLVEKLRKSDHYDSVDSVFEKVGDLAGVRIITYQEADRPKVVEEICSVFGGRNQESVQVEIKDKNGEAGKYYKATHCQVVLTPAYLNDHINLKNTTCEIQVCSLLSHVYNEIEHDLQYKPRNGGLSAEEKLLIEQLGLITRSGDITIRKLLQATNERLKLHKGEFDDVHDFVIRMAELLETGVTFMQNAGLLYDELIALKLNSPEIIMASLLDEEENMTQVAAEEFERLNQYIISHHVPLVMNKKSSDLLLVLLLRRKLDAILKNHLLGTRTENSNRLLQIALVYRDMITLK